jgi:hypothetical protein
MEKRFHFRGSDLIRLDAAFEAVLGMVLVVGVAVGWLGSDDFAAPATTGLVAALGTALLGLAAALWRLSSMEMMLARLAVPAAVNGATALIVAWWGLAAEGFSTRGAVLLWTTVTVLTLLAGAQARVAVRRASEPSPVQH